MLIPKSLFSALLPLTDRDSSRYALGCIKLERHTDGSPVAIVTDGRKLLAYTWVEPNEHPFKPADEARNADFAVLVSAAAIAQVKGWGFDKKILHSRPELDFVYIPETATELVVPIMATDGVNDFKISNAAGDGRFPKWRDCFPAAYSDPATADGESVAITLDPAYVVQLCQAAARLATSGESRGVTLTIPNDPDKPALIRATRFDGSKVASLIMPIARTDRGGRADSGQWSPNAPIRSENEVCQIDLDVASEQAKAARLLADRLSALADSVSLQCDPKTGALPADSYALAALARESTAKANKIEARVEEIARKLADLAKTEVADLTKRIMHMAQPHGAAARKYSKRKANPAAA